MGKVIEGIDESGAGLFRLDEASDTMMIVGTPPWHYSYNEDLVTLLEAGTQVHSADVNRVAGLDWDVIQEPTNDALREGYEALPQDLINFRILPDGRKRAVGYVKKGYEVFQNADAPLFLDTLVDDGSAIYETAGSLKGGAVAWWLMKIPHSVTIGGKDALESFILFNNSHDGSLSLTISIVTVRVLCQNTLSWALSSAKRSLKVRHTKSASQRIQQARQALEIGFKYQEELAKIGDQMINTSFSDADFEKFLNDVVPLPDPEHEISEDGVRIKNQFAITVANKTREPIIDIYHGHPTQQDIKGTLWGAVQACEFYSDHCAHFSSDESRFASLTKGNKSRVGARAFALGQEILAA